MWNRIYAIFQARNREFLRDRAALSWNLILPVALMFGLSLAFGNDRDAYTVGVLQQAEEIDTSSHPFLETRFINFVAYSDIETAMNKVSRHQLDLLVELGDDPRYWVNPESPKGYFAEITLLQAGAAASTNLQKQQIQHIAASRRTTGMKHL